MTPFDIFNLAASTAALVACVIAWRQGARSETVRTVERAERLARRGSTELAARLLVEALDGIEWDRVTADGRRTWTRRAGRLGKLGGK